MRNEVSKLRLSKEEIRILHEQEFFVTKRIIAEKIYHRLSELVASIKSLDSFKAMAIYKGMDITSGKISKGENYLGLPYILLDFPRLFTNEKIVAFRTMIWWGNFLSNTFMKSVDEKNEQEETAKRLLQLKGKGIFFCINASPWHHHFGKDNYAKLESLRKPEIEGYLLKNKFLKVARKSPMNQINRMNEFSVESFEIFSRLL